MKVNDIVNEGVFSDLRAIGRANQAQNAEKIKQALSSFKGEITPQWYKDLSAKVGGEKANQQAGQLAMAWTNAWAKEFERIETAAGKPFSDDDYRGLFRSWLEKAAKVNVNELPLKTLIPVQSLQAVISSKDETIHTLQRSLEESSSVHKILETKLTMLNSQLIELRKTLAEKDILWPL